MLYRCDQNYWANLNQELALSYSINDDGGRSSPPYRILDKPLYSRIGVSACPLTTAKGIKHLANLNYDFFVYKTIRSRFCQPYEMPNVARVEDVLRNQNSGVYTYAVQTSDSTTYSLANSLGMPALSLQAQAEDIAQAKSCLRQGQFMAVSVYGEGETQRQWQNDVINIGRTAREAGADAIEINWSCPNVSQSAAPCDLRLLEQVADELEPAPLIIKLPAAMDVNAGLAVMLEQLASCGVRAVSGINSYPARVINPDKSNTFNTRSWAGVSGYAIQNKALNFAANARRVIENKRLDLELIGVGGIVNADDFDVMLNAGADIALSATGVMLNPYLGRERTYGVEQTRIDTSTV